MYTYIHTYTHTYIHTCKHTYIHEHTCMYTNIHTYIHAYTQTYIRTRVHTYTQIQYLRIQILVTTCGHTSRSPLRTCALSFSCKRNHYLFFSLSQACPPPCPLRPYHSLSRSYLLCDIALGFPRRKIHLGGP